MKTTSDADRADPFGDLTDFIPTTARKTKPELEAIHRALNETPLTNSTSTRLIIKSEKRRQYRTGRNVQFNIRASADTIERFHQIANSQSWTLGETLEYALNALGENLRNT
jgi:hypothetical protein